tara:strand:+ start:104 stop:589 length:486 start_codon:yes stop_codon:yes gene_type:complete
VLSSKDKEKKAPARDKKVASVEDSTTTTAKKQIIKQKKDTTKDQGEITKQRKNQTETAASERTLKELQGQVKEKERPMQTQRPPATIEKTMDIVAKVRRGLRLRSKSRIGYGFSVGELKNAGLGINQARKLGLLVDTRRRTTHDDNVALLKARVTLSKPTS